MSGQTRKHSLLESTVNVFVGYWIAVAATQLIFPAFGIPVEFKQNLLISGLFTVISVVRSYCLRRFFNWIMVRHG